MRIWFGSWTSAGDVVLYDGKLYQFTATHFGAWNENDVAETSIAEMLGK